MLSPSKNSIKHILFICLLIFFYLMMLQSCLVYPISQDQENESQNTIKSPEDEPECWLSQWRGNIEQHQLYLYAVKLFKEPVDYDGKITDTFEGSKFGTIIFSFTGGVKFMIETFPPESSVVTLRVPNGFPDGLEACRVLERYVRETGVCLDWSKSELQKNGAELIRNFLPFDPELNATAFQVYKNGKLIKIGFSMAL